VATKQEVVYYPRPGMGLVEVELLSAKRAASMVPLLLNVIEAAYMRQFEHPFDPKLPHGTVTAKYAATAANRKRYGKKTADHYEQGSVIAAVHAAAPYKGYHLRAFAKISPSSRAAGDKFDGRYLNDVVSMTPGVGFGSIAMHAALARTGQDSDAPLILEAFEGSPVNDWYESLGLEATDVVSTFEFDDEQENSLPMVYYSTPPSAGVGDVVAALEAKRPYLAESW
jgi:hypothetical protein